ncbi:yiaA/B two helix domain family [Oleiphilus messinensis]|uniref:YiaA/B two helix domain family n=2 Tax=Oleiphilus messinensis TaxID=141451 RepID=A0A1Y0I4R3_9GAMM|nr:yiaA/B two helix domain family [Oleiphilus messinensis]
MYDELQSNSKSWLFFVKSSFVCALVAMAAGIIFSPAELMVKGYLGVCALFLVSTTITLSKTMRDEHEQSRLVHKISEARTQQLIKEFGEAA